MTSPIHRFVTRLTKSNAFGRAVEYLPEEVRDALQYFATDEEPSLIRVSAKIHIGEVFGGSVKADHHPDEILPATDES